MRDILDKKLFLATLLILFGVILFIGGPFLIKPRVIEIIPSPAQILQDKTWVGEPAEVSENKTITIILVGDIMLDRGVEYIIKTQGRPTSGGYPDFKFPFLKIAEEFRNADILFGNLEGPISNKGTKVGSIYSFRNDPKAIEGLSYAGFNVISLANNHAFDYGREALEDTFLRLKTAGIDYVGAGFNEGEAYSSVVKEINGMRIAFLAYTNLGPETWKASEKNSGIAWISEKDFEKIREDIKNAKSKSDILIVSLHSGEEYSSSPTQFQIEFSKMAIDAGADIVIGHHPHVVQKNEQYPSGYIFYSLGNFVFDQSFSEETMRGQIVKILIEDDKIKDYNPPATLPAKGWAPRIIPKEIKINEFFQPEIK
jgi:poly-gamma-glutamate synthesis protein (capsule biosynthesis protein)